MSRLIDADEMEQWMQKQKETIEQWSMHIAISNWMDEHEVDAVPVVRCKDCKFFREHLSMNCVYHISAVGENWFCSQGKKVAE